MQQGSRLTSLARKNIIHVNKENKAFATFSKITKGRLFLKNLGQFCSGKVLTNKLPQKQFEKLQNLHFYLEL